ncbi:MAG: phosphoheptose isomerase [Saprospiraceae bacterium]|nr:phosphoheptose isomerase [Bacteroidia bacterium]NNF22924.1 phosphoheptose isomerase [Saprospiraceae bacterium]
MTSFTEEKTPLQSEIADLLLNYNIGIKNQDFSRPWGGFIVIDEKDLKAFVEKFFPELLSKLSVSQNWSPKILFVAPFQKLSWQYHHRRSEVWRVIRGKVGIFRSNTDEQGEQEILMEGDKVELQQGERHRLAGLDQWGIIAEIWQHSDPDNFSNEDDIVRLEDSYGRT